MEEAPVQTNNPSELPPNNTIYINNLNERIKKEGTTLVVATKAFFDLRKSFGCFLWR